jgi:hypothetical protein
MRESKIKIRDNKGQKFTMKIWTPSTQTNLKFWNCGRTRYQEGDWETIDKGFIRFKSGDAFVTDRKSPVLTGYCGSSNSDTFVDVLLGESGAVDGHDYELFKSGMALYNYVDSYGRVQDKGDGEVKQNWVLALEPGTIWWEKVND